MTGRVTILLNPECPHCLHAADTLTDWCCEHGVAVAGVDILHHPEVARRFDATHSPTIVVEGAGPTQVLLDIPSHDELGRLVGA